MQAAINRRQALRAFGVAAATAAGSIMDSATAAEDATLLAIDPKPRFDLSPYLYMQFMEPLGVTDGSVEAAWDGTADAHSGQFGVARQFDIWYTNRFPSAGLPASFLESEEDVEVNWRRCRFDSRML
jgi:hypothetical protein